MRNQFLQCCYALILGDRESFERHRVSVHGAPGAAVLRIREVALFGEPNIGERAARKGFRCVRGEVGIQLIEVGAIDTSWVGERLVLRVDDRGRMVDRSDYQIRIETSESCCVVLKAAQKGMSLPQVGAVGDVAVAECTFGAVQEEQFPEFGDIDQ
ncbi:hypothetical protein MYP14_25270 (plasmid) [Rhodococcus pyridinivorans]|nr:hypothetical protein [Rhodococcus pyridinivorans]UPK66538.1 hypothetical protein MYP14_25270 [Rhodococcus pyridinivorans]